MGFWEVIDHRGISPMNKTNASIKEAQERFLALSTMRIQEVSDSEDDASTLNFDFPLQN